MSNNITSLQNAVIIPTTEQLKGIIREVGREELMEFSTREATDFNLNKESPLYEDVEDILERKKSGKLRFYTHEETWRSVELQVKMHRRDRARVLRK